MKLADWLNLPNPDGSRKRRYAFAQAIDVTPIMVTYYCEGKAWPGREKMAAIARETAGAVTANDFVDMDQGVA